VDLGVLEAAYVYSAAAAAGCTLPSDVFGRRIREHELLTDPLLVNMEHVTIPEGPGLGVEIDHEALAKHETERFEIGG
jgi:muconate cycloisomerase